ncbi:n-acetylglucosamine-6-phosphate deacetylase [Lasius niger]|uniref:N-acetylglucosamine-6-phosphate deacetylase n=1 Tax=Lasius niger TaxID=67767 RepID=A0A0J7KJ29_LASNI|nr:n-acetylglucosamine-6-phosphate deacetylase [Lasius niger]
MRQGWLTLITLTIAGTIAGAEILHQINDASRSDINDFLKNVPPEIGFKYSSVSPAITIQGMNIRDASFHLGTTQFFFKNLCLGHPHIEENILKFSSFTMDHAKIVSEENIFSSRKGILRNFEIVPSSSKNKKWDELVFDENTLEENQGFAPTLPESKKIVASFFHRLSNHTPGLSNIRFGRVQFEKVKIERRFSSPASQAHAQPIRMSRKTRFVLPESPRTQEIRSLIKKDGFIIPTLSVANINIEGYGTGAHPVASLRNFEMQIFYNLLSKNLRNPNDEIRKLTLSLDEGESHEGGNLLQRPGRDEMIAARQFWDNPEKFFNTAPYGLTLLGLHGTLQAPDIPQRSFYIPKITGERRLSSVNDRWAFKSYFDFSGIEANLNNWPKLPEDLTASFNTHGPSVKITSLSVPKDATPTSPASWVSKLTVDVAVDKQNQVKASFALRYPPVTKEIFQNGEQRLAWEKNLQMSNLSAAFSGRELPTLLCASWQSLKETDTVSFKQMLEILHDHSANRPDLENIVEWMSSPQKRSLQATFNLSNFWEWNALPPKEGLGNLPLTEAKIKPL